MTRIKRWFLTFIALFVLMLSASACNFPWETTDLNVSCDTNDLIAAINTANASNDPYTLHLAEGCTYELTEEDNQAGGYAGNGLPAISGAIELYGHNATISRSLNANTPEFRFFYVTEDGWLSIKDLTLLHGRGQSGGAIYVDGGYLFVYGSSLRDNDALLQGEGGAIFNDGKMEIVRGTTFEDNRAMVGGAIATASMMDEDQRIEDCTFLDNNGTWGGGALYRVGGRGETLVRDSSFEGNRSNRGGAVYTDDPLLILTIENSDFVGNGGGTLCGAVFASDGTVNVSNSTFEANEASGGGALCNWGGTLNVVQSTFHQNIVTSQGGAISNSGELSLLDSEFTENSAGGNGGAVESVGDLTVENCTFAANIAMGDGGGISNTNAAYDAPIEVMNSTFSNNQATLGGGLLVGGTGTITHCTFALNQADQGGGIYHEKRALEIQNSIIAMNAGENCRVLPGDFSVVGENISSDASCPGFSTADPMLAPLTMNGGFTETHALMIGSPAIDALSSPCIPVDQRGESRPEGSGCDIGAFEGETEFVDLFPRIEVEAYFPQEETEPPICPLSKMPFVRDASCLEASLSQEQLGQSLPMFVRGTSCLEPGVSMVSIDPGFKDLGAQEITEDMLRFPTGQFEARVNDALQQCETVEAYPGRLFCSGEAPPLNSIMQLSICWQGSDERFPCPPGFVLIQEMGSCMPLSALEDCQIECPDGYMFNPESGRCHVYMGDRLSSAADTIDAPECGDGYVWSTLAGCCTPLNPEEGVYCPKETYYDDVSGFCMSMKGDECPQGFRYEEESGVCRPESDRATEICFWLEQSAPICPQECPAGSVWSSENEQCEVVLICSKDLNQEDCEASGGTWNTPASTAPFCECP